MEINIWQIRTEKDISLAKLEKISGIPHSTLHRIENEEISPTLDRLEQIAKALEVKITDLFESEYK